MFFFRKGLKVSLNETAFIFDFFFRACWYVGLTVEMCWTEHVSHVSLGSLPISRRERVSFVLPMRIIEISSCRVRLIKGSGRF